MGERLCSVGVDVGTTTTQLIVSRIHVENRASAFAVPEMEIRERQVVYRSPVYFTPLIRDQRVDGEKIREIITREYAQAGITRETVDTGAVIITGETSRKENAAAVLENLSDLAGDFVVATAGPHLESVLAAKGAGAVTWSEETGRRVMHFDIGGGTSNLALIEAGEIRQTGCLNVGGRLVKLDDAGRVTYVSPVLEELCKLKAGEPVTENQLREVAQLLVQGLEMAAGLREPTELLARLWTREAGPMWASAPADAVFSFSGGVADCIRRHHNWLAFGDMGPVLGQAIRESRLCSREYRLGAETIRATVIGAGCHSAQLSGSTVFYRNVEFPLKNLPVVTETAELAGLDGPGVLVVSGVRDAGYAAICDLADGLAAEMAGPVLLALEEDAAKALGHALALRLPGDRPILCIDRVRLRAGDYLDVGSPVGPALPVVVKTLILEG